MYEMWETGELQDRRARNLGGERLTPQGDR